MGGRYPESDFDRVGEDVTLREIIAALWRRKWIIVALTVLAAAFALLYVSRLSPDYSSSTTIRVSPLLSQAANTGQLADVSVDADFSMVMSSAVLDPAARSLGLDKGDLNGSVTYVIEPGPESMAQATATTLTITASGSTAAEAQERVKAVTKAFADKLDAEVAETLTTLQTQLQTATDQAIQYQAQATLAPGDAIVASNLTQALARMTALNGQILTVQSAGTSVTTITPAPKGTSNNPSSLAVVGLALLCGLLAGSGIALLLDRLDRRLRETDDLESLTGLPTLAALAEDHAVARKRERLPAGSANRTALSEGLRSLRTSLQVLLTEGKGVVVVTSVEPGDGKTFVSANLALSLARAGRKVILVGGDMRQPALESYFEAAGESTGLADLLRGDADESDALTETDVTDELRSTPYRGLRVLPAGVDVDDPADLLAGEVLGDVIGYLAQNADIVIIDSPPALTLADASELAAHADGVIVLSTVNRTRRDLIVQTIGALESNGATLFGTVVNRTRTRLPKSYDSYYLKSSSPTRSSRTRGGDAEKPTVDALPDETDESAPASEPESASESKGSANGKQGKGRQVKGSQV